MRAVIFFLLACTRVDARSTTPKINITTTTTTTTTTTMTKPPTLSTNISPLGVTVSTTTPAAKAATTTAKTYNCLSGTCIGTASCVSSIVGTCAANNASSGCFRKKTNNTYEVGCTAECVTSANAYAEWCCQGNITCVLGPMPTVPPTGQKAGNESGGTVASSSFVVLMSALFVAPLIHAVQSHRCV